MRGGYVHSQILAVGLRTALERFGARVRAEYAVGPGRGAEAVDLYAERDGVRVAFEVELGPRRVLKDVWKAELLGVDALVIVTPTAKVAALARRRLRTRTPSRVVVHVLPFGRALTLLSQVFDVEPREDGKSENDSLTKRSQRRGDQILGANRRNFGEMRVD